MSGPSDSRLPAGKHVALAAGTAVALVGLGVYLCLRQDNEWERVFVPAAARLWTGDDVYLPGRAYLYPPFTAWATLPFVGLSHDASRLAFVAINLVALVAALAWAWRLAGFRGVDDPLRWAGVLGAGCGVFYLNNCLVHQQTDIVIAALLLGSCLALLRGRALVAASGFGVAAAMKCTPLLWAPYLVWRRRPAAASWLVIVAVGLNFLPDLVNRPAEGGTWLGVFVNRHLSPLGRADHLPGSWNSLIVYNQSLAGAAQRWLLTGPVWTDDDCLILPTGASVPPMLIRALLLAAVLAVCGLTARVFAPPFRASTDREREVLEYGAVLLLMLLLSPMSSAAHFGTLVLPGMLLARRAVVRRDPVLRALLIAALVCAIVSNKDLVGGRVYTTALWCGCVMMNAVFLLVASLRELSAPLAVKVQQTQILPRAA
jgi:hypothetical protein